MKERRDDSREHEGEDRENQEGKEDTKGGRNEIKYREEVCRRRGKAQNQKHFTCRGRMGTSKEGSREFQGRRGNLTQDRCGGKESQRHRGLFRKADTYSREKGGQWQGRDVFWVKQRIQVQG